MTDPAAFVVPGQIKGWVAPYRSGFQDPFTGTVKAGGAATGGRFLDFTTPGDRIVDTSGANSAAVAGLAQHDAAAGALVSVARDGVWPCIASGAIAAGDKLVTDTGGRVKSLGAAAAADARQIVGEAESNAADTAVVRVRVTV